MEPLLGPSVRYTTQHPYVHDYNPLTHLSHARSGSETNSPVDFRSSNPSFSSYAKPSPQFQSSPVKRLAKSMPRTQFTDPLTGRRIDFNAPRSTFASSAAMTLSSKPTDFSPPSMQSSQTYAKTRIRNEMFDPITGHRVTFEPVRSQIESLDTRPRISNPLRLKDALQPPVALSPPPEDSAGTSIANSRRRKADSLAYVSPYQF